jgi:hypothetical protein
MMTSFASLAILQPPIRERFKVAGAAPRWPLLTKRPVDARTTNLKHLPGACRSMQLHFCLQRQGLSACAASNSPVLVVRSAIICH